MKENICKQKKHRRWWIPLAIVAILIAAMINCAIVYVNDYYEADTNAKQALEEVAGVEIICNDDVVLFIPDEIKAGFIFYPGGKVEYIAYAPLMRELAQNGIFCILPHMPCNLAVLDMDAAAEYVQAYTDIEKWYIGGHSLGGAMAASYAAKAFGDFEGLVLCASYSTADLTDSGLNVLSVYGSNDRVLNLEKYLKYRDNLPNGFEEAVIDGGCHAYFGCYGRQEGDGEPAITNKEQIHTTVDFIINFMQK